MPVKWTVRALIGLLSLVFVASLPGVLLFCARSNQLGIWRSNNLRGGGRIRHAYGPALPDGFRPAGGYETFETYGGRGAIDRQPIAGRRLCFFDVVHGAGRHRDGGW